VSEAIHRPAAPAAVATPPRAWSRVALRALGVVALLYLPMLLTERAILGVPLSNMQLLNLGLTQINLMLIAMLGALSLNYLTGCAGLISIGHAAFYAPAPWRPQFSGRNSACLSRSSCSRRV
jgi:ABC-type branched-subunit amino acid transport system permease subunit